MEIVYSEQVNLEQVADLCAVGIKRPPPKPRDYSKWHVSNLLESARIIARGQNVYHEYEGAPSGIMSFGRIWETTVDCYLTRFAIERGGVYIPDVEQEEDGIVGSLDGIMLLPEAGVIVCETKLRFSRQSEEIPLKHLQQMRAYCHLAGAEAVCYVSGYVHSAPPSATATLRLTMFTKQSIEETWGGILSTKRHLESCGVFPAGYIAKDV